MKTKEFIKRVEALGYDTELYPSHITIKTSNIFVANVYTQSLYEINTRKNVKFDLKNKEGLFDLITEYAKTPIEEREESKKYYLKHKWMGHEKLKYLELDTQNDEWYLGHKYDTIFVTAKNEFTQKEIEEIKEKYNTDLSDFEMIEVDE